MKPHSSDGSSDEKNKKSFEEQETVAEHLFATSSAGLPDPTIAAGGQFGPYRLVRLLGQGGSGLVWEAESLETGRRLALKVLTAVRTASPEALERFEREGRLAAAVNHPHWVYLFSAEEIGGYPAITMELMPGGTLQDRLKQQGRLPTKQAVDIILDIIDGLEAAQKAGIVHRDVKPSNCFLDETGRVKIGDFGLSKTLEADSNLTITGAFMGTPSYASPEQVRGRDVDFRSDLYSAGATLYALITGKPPFEAERAGEVLARILAEEPTPFAHHHVDAPKGLQKVVLRTLAKEKEKRYPDYASFRAALLPFSSQGLTTGSLAKRFVAILVDWLIFKPITFPLAFWAFRSGVRLTFLSFGTLGLFFIYFAVTEKYWGRSVGKFVTGLRVTNSAGSALTWRQALLRTTLFLCFYQVPPMVGNLVLPYTLTPLLVVWAGILVMLSTMRSNNGYAGIHELASNTRVRAVRKKESIAVPKFEPKKLEDSGAPPKKFGPYREIGALWETQSEALLVAFDDVLGRNVWIHRFHEDARASPMSQLALNRPGQLYWLQGFRKPENNWDAYEAPSGTSLYHWVKTRKRLSWEEMFAVLYGTLTALKIGLEEGILPTQVSLRHIWVDAYGQVKILSFPATLEEPDRAEAIEVSPENWNLLIHQMLLFGLEGRLVAMENLDSQIPRVPLPEHVRSLIGRICGQRQVLKSLGALIVELKSVAERPAKITRGRRAGPILVTMALPFFSMIMVLLFPLIFSMMPDWSKDITSAPMYAGMLKDLEKTKNTKESQIKMEAIQKILAFSYAKAKSSPQSRQFLPPLNKDSRELLESALKKYPALTPGEVSEARKILNTGSRLKSPFDDMHFFMLCSLILTPLALFSIAAVIISFIIRGGGLLYLFGMAIQTEAGEKANRFRCLLRSLVAWLPALLFPLLAFGLHVRMATSLWFQLTLVLIFIAGAIYSVAKPEKGIQDLIARTRLVPR